MPPQDLIHAADKCVLCGLCSAHCPTYALFREEGESPRGRVMLAAAFLKGELDDSATLRKHLDHCLLCRACEKACPSEVPYGKLLDGVRQQLPENHLASRIVEQLAIHPKLTNFVANSAEIWKKLHLPLPIVGKAALQKTKIEKTGKINKTEFPEWNPAGANFGEPRGMVGLFLGCIAKPFDQQTHFSAIQLLNRLGYNVFIPQNQTCCGAISVHRGNQEQAEKLAQNNKIAFQENFNPFPNTNADIEKKLDAILFTSTGCGTQLIETLSDEIPVLEICQFLAKLPEFQPNFQPEFFSSAQKRTQSITKVALHHPCSLRNALKGTDAVEKLLAQIPNLEIETLDSKFCCGSAGTYSLREPEIAEKLRAPKIDALEKSSAKLLVTTNYGCALHLQAGALERDLLVEVIHPVTLIAQILHCSENRLGLTH